MPFNNYIIIWKFLNECAQCISPYFMYLWILFILFYVLGPACLFILLLFYRHAKQPKPDHPFAWPGQTRRGPQQLQLNSYGS